MLFSVQMAIRSLSVLFSVPWLRSLGLMFSQYVATRSGHLLLSHIMATRSLKMMLSMAMTSLVRIDVFVNLDFAPAICCFQFVDYTLLRYDVLFYHGYTLLEFDVFFGIGYALRA